MSEGSITHCAGATLSFSVPDTKVTRQRCAWCGALLFEYVETPFPYPSGMEPQLPTWDLYALVRIDGSYSESIQLGNATEVDLPADACFKIDLEVTK